MIEAVREIGEYAIRKAEKSIDEPLGILIGDPESNHKYSAYKVEEEHPLKQGLKLL